MDIFWVLLGLVCVLLGLKWLWEVVKQPCGCLLGLLLFGVGLVLLSVSGWVPLG
jgi:hypothetical protein